MRVALCVISIGEKYTEQYTRLFMRSQKAYADRHGYDFKLITSYLSPTHPDSICFQKYLLCSQEWSSSYDFIVYIDADILINSQAPALPFHLLGDKIGMVDEYSQPTPERRSAVQRKNGWEDSATKYHALCGYTFETDHVFNGGLMIFQPIHKPLCESIYSDYAHKNIGHPRGFHFEQTTTNYELQKRTMISTLPNEFNAIVAVAMSDNPQLTISDFFRSNYFVHFAGHYGYEWVENFQSIDFVIARYNEPIEWAQQGNNYNVTIYNKSSIESPSMISLPNVGREAHTYLHHIIQNYDTLASVNIFLQGKISDHKYTENIDDIANYLGISARSCGFSQNFHSTKIGVDVHSDPDFNIRMIDKLITQYGISPSSVAKIQFSDWFTQYIDPVYPDPLIWYGNAIFAVSKDRIHSRSKEFYKTLLSQLSIETSPIEAHFLERSWYYIFNCHLT